MFTLPSNPDRTYSGVKAWAAKNGLSERSVWSYIHEGQLPHVRIGRRVLVPSDALNILATREVPA